MALHYSILCDYLILNIIGGLVWILGCHGLKKVAFVQIIKIKNKHSSCGYLGLISV